MCVNQYRRTVKLGIVAGTMDMDMDAKVRVQILSSHMACVVCYKFVCFIAKGHIQRLYPPPLYNAAIKFTGEIKPINTHQNLPST